MRRALCVMAAAVIACGFTRLAVAETHRVSVGNYWYEDDVQRDRTKIVVRRGDQITFTIRETVYPPHTVDVDELNIHSPGLLLGETYTTPVLDKVGNFKLYCRPHEARGHHTRLIVEAAATATPVPKATASATTLAPPRTAAAPDAPATTGQSTPTPVATLAPVGVGKAKPEDLRRPVAVDPDSLEGLTGRARSDAPWTRAVWFLLIGAVPIVGAGVFALRREFVRAAATSSSARSSRGRERSPARSPRSSKQKASGSGRTSRGRRR
jgi:plastocyanin